MSLRTRDNPAIFQRFARVDIKLRDAENKSGRKQITMTASTDRAVDWGGWREILSHKDGAINYDACAALLLNHDANRIAGPITAIRVGNGKLEVDAEILPDARLESGVLVTDAIESGALRGVSIGYHYLPEDCSHDRDTNTVTVNNWRLLETTLTPIPADDSAGLRNRSHPFKKPDGKNPSKKDIKTMKKFLLWLQERGFIAEKLTEEQFAHLRELHTRNEEPEDSYAEEARAEDDAEEREGDAEEKEGDETERAASMKHVRDIMARSKSLGLDAEKYIDMSPEDAKDAMLRDLANKNRTKKPSTPVVQVTADSGDKILRCARASFYAAGNIKPDAEEQKEMRDARPMGMRHLLREVARQAGYDDANYWSEMELAARAAEFIDLRTFGRRSGANKLVSSFSTLLANTANKAVQAGLDEYDGATWQTWASQRGVANFLQVTNTNLASGRLTLTPEGEAFPELTQKDGGYNSQLGLYGATISVSYQAVINDQLGKILADLRRIGAIAALTVDRQVYYALLNATWTNDVSTSAGLSTPANIDKPRAALKEKLSPAGERMGIVGRFLLHDAANANPAQVATGAIYGQGQTTAPSLGARQVTPIESQWIGDTALLSGAATTDYYLVGNPQVHDTVLVNTLDGVGMSPIIMPFDPGAVAAENYKVMLPFSATVATHTDSAGNSRVSGMQKATA